MSYDVGACNVRLLGQTIGEHFEQTVAEYPNREALVIPYQNVRLTYAELKQEVDQLAKAFIATGLKKGDRIGIWAPNCAEWALVQFATAKIGAILVNINPSYRLHELEFVLNQSECHFVVIADKFKYANYTAMVQELAPELEHCKPGRLNAQRVPHLRKVIRIHSDHIPGMITFDELMAKGDNVDDAELEK